MGTKEQKDMKEVQYNRYRYKDTFTKGVLSKHR